MLILLPQLVHAQGCSRDYGWLENVQDRADLEEHVLEPDTGTSSKIDAIGNGNFGENDTTDTPELTTDTMLQRKNTTFGDTGNPNYTHWIFSRAFRLPSGDTYSSVEKLYENGDTTSEDLMTLGFIHAGLIDGTSDDWLVPFVKNYVQNCHDRPVNVVWFGANVTADGENSYSGGSKWHLTSEKWGPAREDKYPRATESTVVYDVMTESEQIVTGHSTVNCPFDGDDGTVDPGDTAGIYVGGGSETDARRVSTRFGNRSIHVGDNSDSQALCYSGVVDANPVNASERGVQFEYNVNLDRDGNRLDTSAIARAVLAEMNINTGPIIVDGKDAYAEPSGNACGDTSGGAFRLIESGLHRAGSSDTVPVCSGSSDTPTIYRENLSIDTPNLHLTALGDSTETVLEPSNDSVPILDVTSDSFDVQSLSLRSGTTGIRLQGTRNTHLQDLRFLNSYTHGLVANQSGTVVIEDNLFRSNGRRGLELENDTGFTVRNNRFDSSAGSALSMSGTARNLSVLNNTFAGNDTALTVHGGSIRGTELHLNRISGNTVGLYYTGDTILRAESNWWGSTQGPSGEIVDPYSGNTAASTGDSIVLGTNHDTRVAFDPYLNFNPSTLSLTHLTDDTSVTTPSGDTVSVRLNYDTQASGCSSPPANFYGSILPETDSRIASFPVNTSDNLSSNGYDTLLTNVNITPDRHVSAGCVRVEFNIEFLNYDENDQFKPVLYEGDQWRSVDEFGGGSVISDTTPQIVFLAPHFSSFGVVSGPDESSDSSSPDSENTGSSDNNGCLIENTVGSTNFVRNIRDVRDFILNDSSGRWLTVQYYNFFGSESPWH